MKKVSVTKDFIEQSMGMAEDLYGLAEINKSTELKKMFRKHINKCKKYLDGIEQ